MSTQELKKQLIDRIKVEGNSSLLEQAFSLFENAANDSIYELNVAQIKEIKKAQQQIKNGEFLTNEESKKGIQEWLNS